MNDYKPSIKGSLFLLLLGLAFLCIGALTLRDYKLLNSDGVVTEARLTNTQISVSRGKESTMVQYAFSPTPEAPEVTPSDFLGRSNLWITLPPETFKQVAASKTLKVRYLPSNPKNNRPLAAPRKKGDFWTAIGIGSLLTIISIFGIIRSLSNKP